MKLRLLLMAVCVALVAAACTSSTAPRSPSGPDAVSAGPAEAAPVSDARSLFPTSDLELNYRFADKTQSRELLIPDGDRMVQTYNGKTYITWFITADGVFRPDPSDPDNLHLIRFLPAQLQDGLVWEQHGVSDYFSFRLRVVERCGGEGVQFRSCWSLEVLRSDSLTTYLFAPGMGVVGALGDYLEAAESFDKRLTSQASATIAPAQRQAYLNQGLRLSDMAQAEVRQPERDFQEAVNWFKAEPRCGLPSGRKPVMPGASGRLTFVCAGKLWSIDLANGKQTLLYAHTSAILEYAWEPNGRGIAFTVRPRGDLYYRDAASGKVQLIRAGEEDFPLLFWSPDGSILAASLGTSPIRGYELFDRSTGQKVGETSGRGLRLSPTGRRYVMGRGAFVIEPDTPGGSVIIGEITGSGVAERVVAQGNMEWSFTAVRFLADGTLVYGESHLPERSPTAYYSLAPGPDAKPVRLEPSSPVVKEAKAASGRDTVNGREIYDRGTSPDGKWALFVFADESGMYLIRAGLKGGDFVRLPGDDHTWEPRRP